MSGTSGAAGQLTVTSALSDATSGANLANNTGTTGAGCEPDGRWGFVDQRESNTVSNAIPGVTFQLLAASCGTPVQVEITNDNTDIETAVSRFVTAYNAVVKDINDSGGE